MSLLTNRVLTPPLRGLARIFMRASGWTCKMDISPPQKFVAVLAPHTSNWDFIYFIATALVLGLDARFLGKHTLFWGPVGPVMRWFGGVPVNRHRPDGIIPDAINFLNSREEAILAIAPEGTRSRVTSWKTGFYRIAIEAEAPIILTGLDYASKTASVGPIFPATGDLDADMRAIRTYYDDFKGKKPRNQTPT